MSARSQRRAESEERRKQWRLRWIQIGREAALAGDPRPLQRISEDAARLALETPQRQSEIERALLEFRANLEKAILISQPA